MPTFVNPKRRHQNWANKSAASQKRAAVRYQLRSKYRAQGGPNWASNKSLKAQYHAELEAAQALPAAVWQARGGSLASGARSNPAKKRKGMPKRWKKMMSAGGQPLGKNYRYSKKTIHPIDFLQPRRDAGSQGSFYYPKASQFKAATKRRKVQVRWKNQYGSGTSYKWVVDGAQRGRKRVGSKSSKKATVGPVSSGPGLRGVLGGGGRWSSVDSKKPKVGSRQPSAYAKMSGEQRKKYRQAKAEGLSVQEATAVALANPYGALALDNYGALALDNYGALALDNPLPFVGGVVGASKLALTGLVGALGHAYIAPKAEELLEKIPGADKLLSIEVPEALPVVGGMSLTNTIVGILTGAAITGISQYAGRKLGQPMLATYGTALGAGIAIAGPIVDYVGQDDVMGSDEDLAGLALDNYGGLALDNYGGLALDNTGTFGDALGGAYGDGMAYQLGAITSEDQDDFGQTTLADAYYSGADFDLGEGQALVNGRHAFRRRFGHAPQRIATHGGRSAGASHLAGKPGHRWGWLIKMIGWTNVQKLAAMPPEQRVATIKKLRQNALDSFKQMQVEAQEQILAAPELTADGPDGVNGAFGAYGATIFGGAGL